MCALAGSVPEGKAWQEQTGRGEQRPSLAEGVGGSGSSEV